MRSFLLVAVFLLALTACGGGGPRAYRGTLSSTAVSGTTTDSETTTGTVITAYPTMDPGEWFFDFGFIATMANGDTLTFTPGQVRTFMDSSGFMSSVTLSTGSGSMSAETLSLSINGNQTYSQAGQTSTSAFTGTFSGTRE